MATGSSINETCPLEPAFQVVNGSTYNWTNAWDQFRRVDGRNISGRTELQQIWSVNLGKEGKWAKLPGCFILGTINRTKVEDCESYGGMAILNSRTKNVLDADVWYCGFQGGPEHNNDDDINHSIVRMYSPGGLRGILVCNFLENAAPRSSWAWAPMLLVGLTSLAALL